jgi:hypothetical protein
MVFSFQRKDLSLKARALSPFENLGRKLILFISLLSEKVNSFRQKSVFSPENAAKHSHTPHGKGKIYHDFAPQSVRPVEIIVILPLTRQKVLA